MDLSRTARLLGLSLAFALLVAASPGIVTANGLWPLAAVGVACWARYASRPGRWSAAIEFATSALGWCGLMSWATYVFGGTLIFIGPGHGLYFAAQGWVLRRFARRLPLALATPLAWMLSETIRTLLEPPLGLSWMRLGTYLHDQAWIAPSARVWGVGGLSWVLAALGGALADLWQWRRPLAQESKPSSAAPWFGVAFALAWLVVGVALTRGTAPPPTVDGPRLMLVQPGFPQARKQQQDQRLAMMREQVELTRASFAEARAADEPVPDLVVWAETMLRMPIVDPQLADAVEHGTQLDAWRGDPIDAALVRRLEASEREWIHGTLFGAGLAPGRAVIPTGTGFAAGAEYLRPLERRVRFTNSVLLWSGAEGERRGPASKRHLVPGAETMLGLERFGAVRDAIFEIAGYVPDFLVADDDPVLSFTARDGRVFRFAVAVCFDNAFDDVFTGPARDADVDFALVFSNEAWFERSQEVEQMLAYTRLQALCTGRAIVRATQSGVSCVIGPDGREVAWLRDAAGESEMARGTLRATIPVPAGGAWSPFEVLAVGATRERTPYVRWEKLWLALGAALPALALLALRTRGSAKPRR